MKKVVLVAIVLVVMSILFVPAPVVACNSSESSIGVIALGSSFQERHSLESIRISAVGQEAYRGNTIRVTASGEKV